MAVERIDMDKLMDGGRVYLFEKCGECPFLFAMSKKSVSCIVFEKKGLTHLMHAFFDESHWKYNRHPECLLFEINKE